MTEPRELAVVPPFIYLVQSILTGQIKHELLSTLDILRPSDDLAVKDQVLSRRRPYLLQNGGASRRNSRCALASRFPRTRVVTIAARTASFCATRSRIRRLRDPRCTYPCQQRACGDSASGEVNPRVVGHQFFSSPSIRRMMTLRSKSANLGQVNKCSLPLIPLRRMSIKAGGHERWKCFISVYDSRSLHEGVVIRLRETYSRFCSWPAYWPEQLFSHIVVGGVS